eukprot:752899-Hanusia_phi.AAC.3
MVEMTNVPVALFNVTDWGREAIGYESDECEQETEIVTDQWVPAWRDLLDRALEVRRQGKEGEGRRETEMEWKEEGGGGVLIVKGDGRRELEGRGQDKL